MAARKAKRKKKSSVRAKKDVPDATTARKSDSGKGKEDVKMAVFQVGKENFAFSLDDITETLYTFKITPVEHLPDVYKGIIHLQNESLPVVSLRDILHEEGVESSTQLCVIVTIDGDRMGFLINSDVEIVPQSTGMRHALPDCYTPEETEFIEGILWLDKGFVGILNPRRMMEVLAGWRKGDEKK